jgi:HemY protein
LQQLSENYQQLGDWQRLAELLPELEKHKVLPVQQLQQLSEQVWLRRLQHAAAEGLPALRLAWQDMPKPLRTSEVLVSLFMQHLMKAGQETEAGVLLSRQLKLGWSDTLIATLGHLDTRNPQQLLLQLENWLKERPNNAVLLLTLGRISLRNQLWGKAREYFEQALRATKAVPLSAEINAELGRLLESLGEGERSLACYRRAMDLMDHKLPELPQPAGRR